MGDGEAILVDHGHIDEVIFKVAFFWVVHLSIIKVL